MTIKPFVWTAQKPYSEFGLDVTLPYEQWVMINPEGHGLLCAQCIVNRAEKLNGVIAIRATLEIIKQ